MNYPPPGYGLPAAPRRSSLGKVLLGLGLLLILGGVVLLLANPATRNSIFPPAATASPTRPPKTATPVFTPTPRPTATPELSFLGKWEYSDASQTIQFWFQPGGILSLNASGVTADLQYEVVDFDTIKILENQALGVTEGLMDYSVDGNTLYLTMEGTTQTLTRVP